MTIGQLNVALGLLVNKSEWQKGEAYINHFRRIALTFGAVFGGRVLGQAFLGFNQNVEDAKNQIASMLAMTKQSTVSGELENANKLYDMLRDKAMQLPGETQDYVNMLALLTQPLTKAKMGLEDMRDITVGAFITSKAMGDSWQVAARDIGEYINFGKINKVDRYLRKLLEPYGIDATKEGRAKSEKMGVSGRAALIKQAVTSPQEKQMEDQLSKSFSGRVDAIKDTVKQIFGKMGENLFNAVKPALTDLADWLSTNKDAIAAWATNVGTYIAAAFNHFKDGVLWLGAHQDVLVSFLVSLGGYFLFVAARAIVAWFAVAWPMFAGAGLFYMFTKLYEVLGPIPTILIAIGVAALLMWVGLLSPALLLIIAVAAVVAAFYVFRDEAMNVIDTIIGGIEAAIDAIKEFWAFLTGGPTDLLNDMFEASGSAKRVTKNQWDGSLSVGDPARDAGSLPGGGGGSNSTQVNAPTVVNITTKDVNGAKAAFDKAGQDNGEAIARAALRNLGGNF